MPPISFPHHSRDILELKGNQTVATPEQLRQHCPELFDNEYYLEPLRATLNLLCNFGPHDPLMASLSAEDRKGLSAFAEDLKKRTQIAFSTLSFEYAVDHESKNLDADGFTKEHEITVTLSNIRELLKGAEKPMQDIDLLHKLSAALGHLLSEIKWAEAGLPKFEAHNYPHEVEIQVLKSDLKDLEDLGSGLTRAEQAQKETLDKEIRDHQREIARNSEKLNKKKKRISEFKKELEPMVQKLTEFLTHYNPDSPESLPECLNRLVIPDKDAELKPISVQAKVKEILSAKRNGTYVSNNPSLARAKWIEGKKRFLRKWGPRAAVFFALAGGGLYAAREQIKTQLAHSDVPVAEKILGADERLRILKAEFDEELKSNPTELTFMKQKLLEEWVRSSDGSIIRNDRDIQWLGLQTLASDDWRQLANVVIHNSRIITSTGKYFGVRLGEFPEIFRTIFGEDSELILKVGDKEDLVYMPDGLVRPDHQYDLEFFSEIPTPPSLIVKRPLKDVNNYDFFSVYFMTQKDFEYQKKFAITFLAKTKSSTEKKSAAMQDLKDSVLENPFVKLFRDGCTERGNSETSYVFGSDFNDSVHSQDDLKDYLAKALPKLGKDPKVIEYVQKVVRKGPHLAVADKGANVSPESLQKINDGDRIEADDAVPGMISLGMHEQFLANLKNEFGPKTNLEIVFLNDDGKTAISLKEPYHKGMVALSLNIVIDKCRTGAKVIIYVEAPFEDGSGGVQYAQFEIPMLLSEMEGSNKLIGYEGKRFCDELETFKVPGFNGSMAKLIKYMRPEGTLYQKMAYVTSADKVKGILPAVFEEVKNNPQFKKDLEQALSEISPKIQFEHYLYDESGNFERRMFADKPTFFHYGPETLNEKGNYIAFRADPLLTPHLEKFFGEGLVDVRLQGIKKEEIFCESPSNARLEIIFRPTPDHSFSVFSPIDLNMEGMFLGNHLCQSPAENPATTLLSAKEFINSLSFIDLVRSYDLFSKVPDSGVLYMRKSLSSMQKRNDELFGKDLSDEIMNSLALVGIQKSVKAKVMKRFGESAKLGFTEFYDSFSLVNESLAKMNHGIIFNSYRLQALCDADAHGFVSILNSEQRTEYRFPVKPNQIWLFSAVHLCVEIQSLAKPDLQAMTDKLREKTDDLNMAKVRVLDHLDARLEDWQKFEILVEINSIKDLRRFVSDVLPGCTKRVYVKNGRRMVHLEPHPDNTQAMKVLYGKDTVTSLQFFVNGKPDGGFEFGKYRMALDLDFEDFCDFDNIVSLIITRGTLYSPDTIWTPSFYNETCPDKTFRVRDTIKDTPLTSAKKL